MFRLAISNSIQTRGMYIIFILTENFVSKEYLEPKDVHNNVRKWPNLSSIEPWKYLQAKREIFNLIKLAVKVS